MFRFANPQYLWLLLAVPALVALYALAARSRRKRLARFGNPAILEELMPEVSTGRTAFKFILFCTAVALLVLAAARPQFGSKLREEKAQGIEMMLTIDVSNSMLAEDFQPNRLERTKYAIGKLFEGLQQDRVGLVVFAGEPKVQLPITSDYRMARAFARRIDPSLVSVQGTAIGKALKGVSQSGNDMVPGDFIMMTKAVGLEGSGIIASDYEEQLSSVLSAKELARAKSFLELVSVVPEGIAAGSIGTHGMHDITEGGILGAVWEMCQISGRGAQVWEHEIPIEPETVKICDHYEIDPLRLISSGSMVIIVPKEKKEQMKKDMAVQEAVTILADAAKEVEKTEE